MNPGASMWTLLGDSWLVPAFVDIETENKAPEIVDNTQNHVCFFM